MSSKTERKRNLLINNHARASGLSGYALARLRGLHEAYVPVSLVPTVSRAKWGTAPLLVFLVSSCLALMLLTPAHEAEAQTTGEVLSNPGFENTYDSSGLSSGWEYNGWGSPTPSVDFSREVSGVHGGSSAQKMVVNSIPSGGGAMLYQEFSSAAGRTYEASVWLRSPNNISVQILLRCDDYHYLTGATRTITVGQTWQKVTIRGGFARPECTTATTRFAIQPRSKGTLVVDDASLANVTSSANSSPTPTDTIPASFFGTHINKGHNQYWPSMDQGMIRLWDTGTNWKDVEPTNNGWDWERLDLYVDTLTKANCPSCEITYTMGITPTWAAPTGAPASPYGGSTAPPTNMEDWRDYVRAVGNRYKGKIKYWEIWNEVNAEGGGKYTFYSGSKDKLVEMTRIASEELKAIDPNNVILAPNVTETGLGYLDDLLRKGVGRYTDVISYHQYPNYSPENSVPAYEAVKNVMQNNGVESKPIWNTEGANEGSTSTSEDQSGARCRGTI